MKHLAAHLARGLALSITLVATACDRVRNDPGSDALARQGVDQAIDSLNARIERADIDAILQSLADDYVLRRADGLVRGRDAMRPVWEENFRGYAYVDSRFTIERFSASGDLAVASGMIGGLLRPKDRPVTAPPDTFELPYLAEWTRDSTGRWMLRDLAVIYPGGR